MQSLTFDPTPPLSAPCSASAATGADRVWQTLIRLGVDLVFGYPGGQVIPLYDALPNYPLRHVLPRHEQALAHMADGYARASGRPSVAVATSGPGATNLVTGMATARADEVPVVFVTGQVPTHLLGTDAFQEVDILGVSLPITKHGWLLRTAQEIEPVLCHAYAMAQEVPRGPVVVDIPKNLQTASAESRLGWLAPAHRQGEHDQTEVRPEAVASLGTAAREAARVILESHRGRAWLVVDGDCIGEPRRPGRIDVRAEHLLVPAGLGTLGYALPAAVGTRLARPRDEVWAIMGSIGFERTVAELLTTAQEQAPIRVLVVGAPGRPDLVRLAEASGVGALRASGQAGLKSAVSQARRWPGTVVIDATGS